MSAPDEWPSSGTWQPSSTSDPISNKRYASSTNILTRKPARLTVKSRPQPPTLPPLEIQLLAIDDFFSRYHGQPYCFFHEESFRLQFSRGLLPDYLVLAVLCIALRYSKDNYDSTGTIAADLAAKGWSLVLGLAFDGAQAPTYRLVQAATLLALFDFTGKPLLRFIYISNHFSLPTWHRMDQDWCCCQPLTSLTHDRGTQR